MIRRLACGLTLFQSYLAFYCQHSKPTTEETLSANPLQWLVFTLALEKSNLISRLGLGSGPTTPDDQILNARLFLFLYDARPYPLKSKESR